ncbi:MAG TPA: putative Ig domain-containing protein [Streptosporangiaceae bacterium]
MRYRFRRMSALTVVVLALFLINSLASGSMVLAGISAGTSALTITSTPHATLESQIPLNFRITTSGTPIPSIAETGILPQGITFTDNGDGTATLSGLVPEVNYGKVEVTITASNGVGSSAVQHFILYTKAGLIVPKFVGSHSETVTYGVTAEPVTILAVGHPPPRILHTGRPPEGMHFSEASNGTELMIYGTPQKSAVGTYTIMLHAHSKAGAVTEAFTVNVIKAPTLDKLQATRVVNEGASVNLTITARGFTTPTLGETGILPSGIGFADNGDGTASITGTPAPGTSGSYPVSITATNPQGVASQSITLVVAVTPSITSANTATARVGNSFSFSFTATGFPAPIISKTGRLPDGIHLTLNNRGLTGTPFKGTQGDYPITITATNHAGTTTQQFTLVVS